METVSNSEGKTLHAELRPIWGIFQLACAAFLPVCVAGSLLCALHIAKPDRFTQPWYFLWGDTVIAAPLFETAFMFPVLAILKRTGLKRTYLAIVSSALWATAHGLRNPVQGILVIWPFYLFSENILRWDPISRNRAYCYTVLLHALFNAGVTAMELCYWF